MLWKVDGRTVSCESVMPFIEEIPMWRYAVSADQPNVDISLFFNASVVVWVSEATLPLPKSKGIWVYSSVFSMSMSIALRLYALTTCWYAPASAEAELQFGPSLLPLQPPKEITMSPPAARIALMFCWSTPPVRERWLSHIGVQPPPESMNASVNDLTPVALITEVGDGGSPQPK